MTAPAPTPTPPTELAFTPGDTEHERLRTLALADLYWFASVVLGYGAVVPMHEHAHRLLCRFAEGRTGCPALDEKHIRKLELPREWGKTTLITQALTIQDIARDPNISILIANEKEQNAKDFLAAIQWQFESNEFFRALFPEIIPPDFNATTWSASRMIVPRTSGRKEPTVFVIGAGGTVTGMHPDKVRVDDMISREAMENARAGSWQIMHQTNRWINQLYPLVNKSYPRWAIEFTGTRWWHGDSYEHIDKAYGYDEPATTYTLRCRLPSGETQLIPAYTMGDLAIFRRAAIENGRSAFPEKWTLDDLAKMRLRDEALFACNMMNQPSDDQTATFKASWLKYYDWVDDRQLVYTDGTAAKRLTSIDQLDVICIVDPGGFARRQVEDRARAAIVTLGDDGRGNYLLIDCYSEKDTFLACIETLCGWVTRYSPRKVVIERAGQQAAFIELVRRAFRERGITNVSLEEVEPKKIDKDVRILGLEPYFQRGSVYVGKGANMHEFRQQYSQFPRTSRVDVLDTLAYFPRVVRRTASGAAQSRNAAQRHAEELATYRMRRGLT